MTKAGCSYNLQQDVIRGLGKCKEIPAIKNLKLTTKGGCSQIREWDWVPLQGSPTAAFLLSSWLASLGQTSSFRLCSQPIAMSQQTPYPPSRAALVWFHLLQIQSLNSLWPWDGKTFSFYLHLQVLSSAPEFNCTQEDGPWQLLRHLRKIFFRTPPRYRVCSTIRFLAEYNNLTSVFSPKLPVFLQLKVNTRPIFFPANFIHTHTHTAIYWKFIFPPNSYVET